MNFIFILAHWCEVHGPTSILCTEALPPACGTCYPSAQTHQYSPTPPQSSDGLADAAPTPPPRPRGTNGVSMATGVPSPAETPPASPRTSSIPLFHAGVGSAIPGGASGTASDACKNCSISFPKSVMAKRGSGSGSSTPNSGTASPTTNTGSGLVSSKGRSIRSTQVVQVGFPEESHWRPEYDRDQEPFSVHRSQTSSASDANPRSPATHVHTITYLSDRHPITPSHYSAVRSSCVRTFTCESVPGQTGPFMFGDPLAGYTLAYVFKIPDRKARGGIRTYALLCLCPDQRALMKSWGFVEMHFDRLAKQIRHSAEKKAAEETSQNVAIDFAAAPEGFLRSRAPGGGGSPKDLAELCGREDLFFFIHQTFGWLLMMLAQTHGFPAGGEAQPLAIAAPEGRGRTASLSAIETRNWSPTRQHPQHIPPPHSRLTPSPASSIQSNASSKTITPETMKSTFAKPPPPSPQPQQQSITWGGADELAWKTAGLSVADSMKPRSPPRHSRNASMTVKAKREREERRGSRPVAVGY